MMDYAKATRATFLDAQLKHPRTTRLLRWMGAAVRRIRSIHQSDPLDGLRLVVESDATGLAYVAVRRTCASIGWCGTNKKERLPLVSRQA